MKCNIHLHVHNGILVITVSTYISSFLTYIPYSFYIIYNRCFLNVTEGHAMTILTCSSNRNHCLLVLITVQFKSSYSATQRRYHKGIYAWKTMRENAHSSIHKFTIPKETYFFLKKLFLFFWTNFGGHKFFLWSHWYPKETYLVQIYLNNTDLVLTHLLMLYPVNCILESSENPIFTFSTTWTAFISNKNTFQ